MRGYVRYTAKPPVPSYVITRGHFVAYFQEAGTWYVADDARMEALERMPDAFPFICFFERVGVERSALLELPSNPICAAPGSADGANRPEAHPQSNMRSARSSSATNAPRDSVDGASQGEGGGATKRRRLVGKQPPRFDDRQRVGRHQDRADRHQDRAGRHQEQLGRRTMQQRRDDIKRLRTSGAAGDNIDGSRTDIAADGDDPVGRFISQRKDSALAGHEMRRLACLYADLKARRAAQAITDSSFHEELLRFSAENWDMGECFVALVAGFDCTPDGAARLGIREVVRRGRVEKRLDEMM